MVWATHNEFPSFLITHSIAFFRCRQLFFLVLLLISFHDLSQIFSAFITKNYSVQKWFASYLEKAKQILTTDEMCFLVNRYGIQTSALFTFLQLEEKEILFACYVFLAISYNVRNRLDCEVFFFIKFWRLTSIKFRKPPHPLLSNL